MEHVCADTSGALVWEECIEDALVYMAGGDPSSAGSVLPASGKHFVCAFRFGVCVVSDGDEHRVWRFDVTPHDIEVSARLACCIADGSASERQYTAW